MAGVDFSGVYSGAEPDQGVVTRVINFVGAASSVALVVGVGYWGYQLAVRDVTEVPVIRALEGEARVQPDEPGGQLAQHTGLSVNELQAEGTAGGPVDRVILAPPRIDLNASDATGPAPERGLLPTNASLTAREADAPVAPEASEDDVRATALALAERLAAEDEPLEPLAPVITEDTPMQPQKVALAVIPRSVPGVALSPRPDLRPEFDPARFTQSASISAAVATAVELDPAGIAPGTRLVQLGAFDSRAVAAREWERLSQLFPDYMRDKPLVISEARSGGRLFFRLRAAGFEDLAASRRFCAVLTAGKAQCIPVRAE